MNIYPTNDPKEFTVGNNLEGVLIYGGNYEKTEGYFKKADYVHHYNSKELRQIADWLDEMNSEEIK